MALCLIKVLAGQILLCVFVEKIVAAHAIVCALTIRYDAMAVVAVVL